MSPHPWPYATDPAATPPLDADRLILWLARHQWRTLLGGVLFGVPWMLSIALVVVAGVTCPAVMVAVCAPAAARRVMGIVR